MKYWECWYLKHTYSRIGKKLTILFLFICLFLYKDKSNIHVFIHPQSKSAKKKKKRTKNWDNKSILSVKIMYKVRWSAPFLLEEVRLVNVINENLLLVKKTSSIRFYKTVFTVAPVISFFIATSKTFSFILLLLSVPHCMSS